TRPAGDVLLGDHAARALVPARARRAAAAGRRRALNGHGDPCVDHRMRALAVLSVLAACGAAPPPAAPIANRGPAPDADLVGRAPAQGAPTTRWVDAGGRVIGTAPGIVIASGVRLYRLATREVSTQLSTCEQIDAESQDPPAGEASKGVLISLEPI